MNKVTLVLLMVVILLVVACQPKLVAFASDESPDEQNLLYTLLMQLISGGLAAVIVWKFLDAPVGKELARKLFEAIARVGLGLELGEVTRYTAIVLSGLVSLAAYGVAMAFGYVSDPGTVEGWINLVLALLGVSFTGSQVVHARIKATRLHAVLAEMRLQAMMAQEHESTER